MTIARTLLLRGRNGSAGLVLVGSLALAWAASCSEDENVTGSSGSSMGTASSMGGSAAMGSGGGFSSSSGSMMCVADLQSIALSPAGSMVLLDGSAPAAPVNFTATGTLANGQTIPLGGSQLEWSVSRDDSTDPGTIADGVLSPNPSSGGVVHVTATDGCVTGTTDVTFMLDATIGTPTGDWGGPVVTGDPSPEIVYPSDQTVFPRNIYRTLFQWHTKGFTQFRLVYEGPNSTVTVYTDGVHALCTGKNPAAGCWEVDETAWNFIAGSNAGASADWRVDALDTSTTPPTVREGAPISIGFSKQDVEGAIFYWSTTSAGVRRGRISEQNPEDYISGKPGTTYPNGDKVQCVACHVVSRDGQYLAAPVQSNLGQSVWVTGVTAQPPPTELVTNIAQTTGHGFATFSPDDAHLVVAFGGKMWMVDRTNGMKENDLPTGMMGGTQPDWSPAGDRVVFATGNGDAPKNSSLAMIPFDNGTWGTPTTFLAPPAMKSNLFPMFSPNGDWIAFSQGKGDHGDNTAQLEVVSSQPGSTPIELINANRVTSNKMTTGQYENNQPTWAPPGDYHWIAFATKREYGVVQAAGTQQIWVAAIDPAKAAQGMDPSYPAFRVPFQGLKENNHRAYWTLDVSTGSGGGGAGGGGGEGGAGGGGSTGCSMILSQNQVCDPLNDCCQTSLYCDTIDSGTTYVCLPIVPS